VGGAEVVGVWGWLRSEWIFMLTFEKVVDGTAVFDQVDLGLRPKT